MAITFREIEASDAEMLWNWRTKPRVNKFMSTAPESFGVHVNWLSNSYDRDDYYHWIIQINKIDVGLINVAKLSPDDRTCEWGIYLGEDDYLGYGAFVPPYFYNWVFANLPIDKIEAHVFSDNCQVIRMHKLHGYLFCPYLDYQIEKNGCLCWLRYGFLDRNIWGTKVNFHRFSASFPTKKWKGIK